MSRIWKKDRLFSYLAKFEQRIRSQEGRGVSIKKVDMPEIAEFTRNALRRLLGVKQKQAGRPQIVDAISIWLIEYYGDGKSHGHDKYPSYDELRREYQVTPFPSTGSYGTAKRVAMAAVMLKSGHPNGDYPPLDEFKKVNQWKSVLNDSDYKVAISIQNRI